MDKRVLPAVPVPRLRLFQDLRVLAGTLRNLATNEITSFHVDEGSGEVDIPVVNGLFAIIEQAESIYPTIVPRLRLIQDRLYAACNMATLADRDGNAQAAIIHLRKAYTDLQQHCSDLEHTAYELYEACLDEDKSFSLGAELWQKGKSWREVTETLHPTVSIGQDLINAVRQGVIRHAKKNKINLRTGKPGRRRNATS